MQSKVSIVNIYLLWLFQMLKAIKPMATMIPMLDIKHMQMNKGKETVRNTRLMIVLS